MKNLKYIFSAILLISSLSGCNDFLSEKPNKSSSLVPTTVEQLDYLFNDYYSFYQEGNRAAIFSSDSYGLISEMYDVKNTAYNITAVEFATWDREYLVNDGRESYFSGEYLRIFIANMVLYNLDRVSGSPEAKEQLRREANFIKAYSLFNLVQTYCLPYTEANKDELGMTIKESVSFEELTARATLAETYAAIEGYLNEALKITNDMKLVNNKYNSWRANKAAVNGFAARFYLVLGDYNKAMQYANVALASHSLLVDYNKDMRYSSREVFVTINGKDKVEIKYPYTHDNQTDMTDMLEWKEQMYFRMMYTEDWWFVPSKELLAKYDSNNDLRYKYHIVKNYSYHRGLNNPAYEYPGYIFFFKDRIPSGPTTAEMLLIKAECLARLDKVGEAMATVNILRDKRMLASASVNERHLSANSKDEAIAKIIDERWREMPFTQRWNDIRRLNHNKDSNDNIGELKRSFYPYNSAGINKGEGLKTFTLPVGSRLYAAPIHSSEILSSNGAIQQNKY